MAKLLQKAVVEVEENTEKMSSEFDSLLKITDELMKDKNVRLNRSSNRSDPKKLEDGIRVMRGVIKSLNDMQDIAKRSK